MELNASPSFWLQAGFIFTAISVAIWWIWAFQTASFQSHIKQNLEINLAHSARRKSLTISIIILSLLLGITAFISQQSWAHNFETFPPPALRVFVVIILLTSIIAFSRAGTLLIKHIPIALLIGFQAFRIPVEILIHQAYSENITIIDMTYLGTNFDIISGISALLLAIYLVKKNVPNSVLFAWNCLGLALLINVVATGIMSMPHPLQSIATDFPNVWITYFPFIWLPAILVCSALLGHLLVFRYLLQRSSNPVLIEQSEKV